MMEDKPKPSKSKYDASQKVYERDQYIILQVKSGKKIGYIAYNTKKDWEDGHTHGKNSYFKCYKTQETKD